MTMFNINLGETKIDETLYTQDEGQRFAGISWHGKYKGDRAATGFFALDVDAIPKGEEPQGWERTQMQYGDDPNADLVDVYQTTRLVAVPIGVRKRMVITDEYGNEHVYPWRTKKENRVKGRFTSHYQIMVKVPGLTEPCVLGLRGQTKTTAWDNDAGGRYRNNDFPTGIEQLLRAFAHEASKVNKYPMPTLCLWWIALVPVLNSNGQPHYVSVGRGENTVHMNPFTAEMHPQNPAFLNAKFVGEGDFAAFQELRNDVAVEWEKQWTDAAVMQQQAGAGGNGGSSDSIFAPLNATPRPEYIEGATVGVDGAIADDLPF